MEVARSVLWVPDYTEAPVSLLCKQSEPPLIGSFRWTSCESGSQERHDFYELQFKLEHDGRSLRTETYFRSSLLSHRESLEAKNSREKWKERFYYDLLDAIT